MLRNSWSAMRASSHWRLLARPEKVRTECSAKSQSLTEASSASMAVAETRSPSLTVPMKRTTVAIDVASTPVTRNASDGEPIGEAGADPFELAVGLCGSDCEVDSGAHAATTANVKSAIETVCGIRVLDNRGRNPNHGQCNPQKTDSHGQWLRPLAQARARRSVVPSRCHHGHCRGRAHHAVQSKHGD
jgi:hypothetical protein